MPEPADASPSTAPAGRQLGGSERAAVWAFGVVGAIASAFYLVVGRRVWFRNDEWDFLTTRTAFDLHDLFKSHYGHWSTLPILVYRFLWWTFGLRTYVPYLILIIGLHLLAAWLIRCVMRRAGVRPWTATATALVLVLFGRGHQDIVWAFQITQVGSLVFGLTHLLLSDHDGPFDSRDRLGLAAGFAGMLCSGVGVAMVIVVGIAALIRRGWRIAAAHTAPLGLVYLVWFSTMARNAYTTSGSTWLKKAKFVVATILNAFRGMSAFRGGQWLVIALLAVGLVFAWRRLTRAELSTRAAAPFALLIGAGVFLLITSVGRAGLPGATYRSRYVDLALAMLLPAIGVAADAVIRWRRALTIPVFALLLIGVPGNMRAIATYTADQQKGTDLYRHTLFALPRHRLSRQVPRASEPIPGIAIGWLVDGAKSGRIPPPGAISPAETATNTVRLSLRPRKGRGAGSSACRRLSRSTTIRLRANDALLVARGTILAVPPTGSFAGTYPPSYGSGVSLSPVFSQITFRALPVTSPRSTRVCGPTRIFRPR